MKLNLDLTNVNAEKESKCDFVPAGRYEAEICEVEFVKNEVSGNYRMDIFFKILSGEHEGKTVRDMLNPYHSSAEAQRISLERLKGILEKIGHANPNMLGSEDEMIGGQLILDVIEDSFTNNDGDEIMTNKIKKISALEGAEAPAAPKAPVKKAPAKRAPAKKAAPASSPNKPTPAAPVAEDKPAAAGSPPWMK